MKIKKPSSTQPAKVLVVDDSPTLLLFTRDALERGGYRVESTSEYYIAGLVSKFQPDLILMDVNLGLSYKGPSAVQALKNRSFTSGSIFILYSTLEESELERLTEECGADGWLRKTRDAALLCREVDRLLARKAVAGAP